MARYDVYGLGNALVDIEVQVSPETLQTLGVEKGVMTLLDEAAQNQILTHLGDTEKKLSCGGSAANTIIAISQLGGKSFYSCKVAPDDQGKFYLEDMSRCQVTTNAHGTEPGITGKCLVFVTPDADRTMNTFLGISSSFSTAELVPEAIADSTYTYIEGYLVTGDASKAAAIEAGNLARAAGQKVSLTLSDLNMVKFFKAGLVEMVGPGVDLLFANESEALEMAGTQSMAEAIDYLKTISKTFAVTLGPKGSVIFDGEQLIEIAATPVTAIDTVGAGDMYAGGVLYGITNGLGWAKAGALGSRASSMLVTMPGARMLTDQLQGLLAGL
jgi:sugar/nucleoside kinase (ribokinase family)